MAALGHVHDRCHELGDLSGRIEDGLGGREQSSLSGIRDYHAEFRFHSPPLADPSLEHFDRDRPILGMKAAAKVSQRRDAPFRIEAVEARVLRGRVGHLPVGHGERHTPGAGEPLSLRQVGLASFEFGASFRHIDLQPLPSRDGRGVGDRGRNELREVLEAGLGLRRKRLLTRRGCGHHAPRPPPHGDRSADGGANAHPPDRGRNGAVGLLVVVHARRSSAPEHSHGHAVALERKGISNLDARVTTPLRDADYRAVLVEATQVRGVHAEQLADLPHHGGEHRVGRCLTRDQRGHAPQRGLLLRGAAALGHVAARGIEKAFLRHDARLPFHPAQRAVATDDPVAQLHDIGTALERRGGLCHPLAVVRVGELDPRPRQQLLPRVAEHFERRVEPFQVTVQARDGEQSRRHLEDSLGLSLSSQPTSL
ncbi:MAG TPA: hypothetical protein VFQ12_12325 [Thermoleophilaceae bacterium]|nr:hypothetical protein [Thermoleophilaceae bacterium]